MNTSSRTTQLLEGSIIRSLLTLALPIVLTNLLQSGYQLTDAFWVGRLGGEAVAAVSVSFPIIFLMIALGAGFSIAGSTLVAQYTGARNDRMVNHVTAQTLIMVLLSAITLGIIGFVCAPGILRLIGVEPSVFNQALGFLRVSFVGMLFMFTFASFQSIMNAIGQTRIPTMIVFGTVLLNLLLDPLFIFGWGPIPGLGVMGAALATVGTQFLASLIGLIILLRGNYGIKLHLRDFTPDRTYIKRAFKLGFPASIEQSSRALGMSVLTFLVASFGTLSVAAYGVGGNVTMIVIIPAFGLSIAIGVLVGQNIGAGKIERAQAVAKLGQWLSFITLTVCGLLAFTFAHHIARFFVPGDADVIREGARFIQIMSFSFGLIGVQMAVNGILRAAGNMMAPMMMTIVSQWVVLFPLAYILSKHTDFGITGLWYAFPIANVIMVVIALVWFNKIPWQTKNLTKEDHEEIRATQEILIEEGVRG
ncbi:MATE family efflux transporter [Patescibacteria group bacterium]|nr:MATE family efflux transporter [Patescibacteria group bacterium]